ncbi:hypothetical protein HHI36_009480 [Cryptolaemus montrouzieri]|uniref:Uncharacterized protein n=1 Tax=Cryptolaemus montrouzieri TaxID=559131 RepID=A0ABD2MFS9_9CUCU
MNDLPKYEYSTFLGKKENDDLVFVPHQQRVVSETPFVNTTLFVEEIFPPYAPNITNTSNNTQIYNLTKGELYTYNGTVFLGSLINKTSRQVELINSTLRNQLATQLEAQEEGESEEEGGNMITGLISALLGGLSRPDGSIDVEAITGLLGSLSVQRPDGTYDFMGITDLLRGFFGGGDGGGGSDIGSFVGGLTGALLQGLANPPGAVSL